MGVQRQLEPAEAPPCHYPSTDLLCIGPTCRQCVPQFADEVARVAAGHVLDRPVSHGAEPGSSMLGEEDEQLKRLGGDRLPQAVDHHRLLGPPNDEFRLMPLRFKRNRVETFQLYNTSAS
jgi:hypothetical protein